MKYVYGPVQSRRLGTSLGVSLTPHKTCPFDCVYCQLGATTDKTLERAVYIPSADIIAEVKSWMDVNAAQIKGLSFITLSGPGEPTLHSEISTIISQLKKISSIPVAVITNSCFMGEAAVRRELLEANLIVPSLDAASSEVFARIDLAVFLF